MASKFECPLCAQLVQKRHRLFRPVNRLNHWILSNQANFQLARDHCLQPASVHLNFGLGFGRRHFSCGCHSGRLLTRPISCVVFFWEMRAWFLCDDGKAALLIAASRLRSFFTNILKWAPVTAPIRAIHYIMIDYREVLPVWVKNGEGPFAQ